MYFCHCSPNQVCTDRQNSEDSANLTPPDVLFHCVSSYCAAGPGLRSATGFCFLACTPSSAWFYSTPSCCWSTSGRPWPQTSSSSSLSTWLASLSTTWRRRASAAPSWTRGTASRPDWRWRTRMRSWSVLLHCTLILRGGPKKMHIRQMWFPFRATS